MKSMNFKKYHVSRNLLDLAIIENGKGIDNNGNIITQSTRIATVQPIDITEIDSAVLSYASVNPINFLYAVLNNSTLVRRVGGKATGDTLDLQDGNELYLCWYYQDTVTKSDINDVMLNIGSNPLPYEPYSSEVWHDLTSHIMSTTWQDGSTYSRSGGSWSAAAKKRSRKKK